MNFTSQNSQTSFDFIGLANAVEARYRSYLQSTFHFSDPGLRQSFEDALKEGKLAKGPYVEAIPAFSLADALVDLADKRLGLSLHPGFSSALHGARPLYSHQVEAIRKAWNGHNIVVATGTGSGKTEAFLLPILLSLYREALQGPRRAGVRAMILYPMNALANDQRDRLREIDRQLVANGSPFTFTFGQYTGETPEDERDRSRFMDPAVSSPNEKIFRREIRESPPDILLTNYSMLEYLMIRPDDSPLFDNGRSAFWSFIILDEAHQYRGANGIEMAMLLRRLKHRVRAGGARGQLQCIATSATLGGGESDRAEVAEFASRLFDEPFEPADIIFPAEEEQHEVLPDLSLNHSVYPRIERAFLEGSHPAELLPGIWRADGDSMGDLGNVLMRDHAASQVIKTIRHSPILLSDLAEMVLPGLSEFESYESLGSLLRLLSSAKTDDGQPLLSSRIHLLLRSLEGAFLSYSPEPRITLERRPAEEDLFTFEVALCRECGQHYIAGQIQGHNPPRLVEAIRDPSQPDFGVKFFRPMGEADQFDEDLAEPSSVLRMYRLCTKCGVLSDIGHTPSPCGHDAHVTIEEQPESDSRADRARQCAVCGYRGQDPIGEVVHGTDGPHAVVATTLFQELEPERKKVLAFADGRQQAAFFAWYLDSSYRELLARQLIYQSTRHFHEQAASGLSLREVTEELKDKLAAAGATPESAGQIERSRVAWREVYREFLAEQRRISLEGVGLVQWAMVWPSRFEPPAILLQPPWSLTRATALELISGLFETLRVRRAVALRTEDRVPLNWDDLGLRAAQVSARIGSPRGNPYLISWDGPRTHRMDILRRFMGALGVTGTSDDTLLGTLRDVWEHLRNFDARQPAGEGLLLDTSDGRQLNPAWWRIKLPDEVYQCTLCSRIQSIRLNGVCIRFGCSGTVEPIQAAALASNHYRRLAQEPLPGSMRVEEHTAQLSGDLARQYQEDFKRGRINILSCSTTFELGVDLGDLDTVFLRNVPPEASNYAQRVGRAGRRPGRPGFAVTYCTRGPHDLYHFADPLRLIAGRVRPPTLRIDNPKIATRHIAAVIIGAFLSAFPERFRSLGSLMGDLERPDIVEALRSYVQEHESHLQGVLREVVSAGRLHEYFGLDKNSLLWADQISGQDSRLALAVLETASEYRQILDHEKTSSAERRYSEAQWARQRANTLEREDVLSFLSRKAIIPKYGFPVDVVSLETRLASDDQTVDLDRDLSIAIAEFAPGAELVANKRLWTSQALRKVPEREWRREDYMICRKHGLFVSWIDSQPAVEPCCEELRPSPHQYVVPEFGFTTGRNKPTEPKRRPSREYSTRPYLVAKETTAPASEFPTKNPAVRVYKAEPGEMVVLSEGRRGEGFRICPACGSLTAPPSRRRSAHHTPFGRTCDQVGTIVALGHRFTTDVVRIQFLKTPSGASLSPEDLAWSLGYALVEGAAAVTGSPSSDLNVTITYDRNGIVAPIVIYDSVPGGAGLVGSLESETRLRETLRAALERVDGRCGCSPDQSCYGCLRSYRNQFVHTRLSRGAVLDYLRGILEEWGLQ
jgi:hypothetical protein